MEILALINKLHDLISDGRPMPMTSSVLVDREEALETLHTMRINVPSAIKEGELMVQERSRIISEANSRAEEILEDAERQSKDLVSEQEVMRQARSEQETVLEQTRREVDRMRFDAEQYQLGILRDLQGALSGLLNEVQRGISKLEDQPEV